MRMFLMTGALLACAVPAKAQQHDAHHGSGGHHAAGGEFPDGWQGRVDREGQKLEEVRFMAMGGGLHAITGPHVILRNRANHGTGTYTATATFAQNRAPERLEGFGLVVGGRDLNEPGQDYPYFLIRHDGSYVIRHRAGAEAHTDFALTPRE